MENRDGQIKLERGRLARNEMERAPITNMHQSDPILWYESELIDRFFFEYFKACEPPNIQRLAVVGDFRRCCETVNRLDYLVVCDSPELFHQQVQQCPAIEKILAHRSHWLEVKLLDTRPDRKGFHTLPGQDTAQNFWPSFFGIPVSFRIVCEEELGTAFWKYTGSANHLKKMKTRFGDTIFSNRFATEFDFCQSLEIPWIPPELREGRHELDWAVSNALPKLIQRRDLKGDLHSHTDWTDGRNVPQEMLLAAQYRGLEYFAITDHSQRVMQCNGLNEKRLLIQWKLLDQLQEDINEHFEQNRSAFPRRSAPIQMLKGVEVDILESGQLDISNEVLAQADWVVASLHFEHNQPQAQLTQRLLSAIENPHVCVIAHPTGRYLPYGGGYDADFETVFSAAAEHGCFLEINSHPRRLDLSDVHCIKAKELGVKMIISSDAHTIFALSLTRFGVNQARRAGLTASDVANTRSWPELQQMSKKQTKQTK